MHTCVERRHFAFVHLPKVLSLIRSPLRRAPQGNAGIGEVRHACIALARSIVLSTSCRAPQIHLNCQGFQRGMTSL